jgi:hypothetical protein
VSCARCCRPIAGAVHRTPLGDFHGACLAELEAEERAGDERRRAQAIDRTDRVRRAQSQLEADERSAAPGRVRP